MIYVHPRLLEFEGESARKKFSSHVTLENSTSKKFSNCAKSMYEKVDRMTSTKKNSFCVMNDILCFGKKCKMINHNGNDL